MEKLAQTLIHDMNVDHNIENGTYIIDRACGVGKTTEIFDFICHHYDEGILYCVDSIVELHKMYDKLYFALVNSGYISPDDIMMITSEQSAEAISIRNIYHANPEVLLIRKIILITHVRFFSSMINYFVIYNPISEVPPFDGNFNILFSRHDLRKWIFFDETPMWIRPFKIMPKCLLGAFSDEINGIWQCKSPSGIVKVYNDFIKHTKQDPFCHETQLDAITLQSVLSMIPVMYPIWKSEVKMKDLEIIFRPRNLASPDMQTHILFFEGAADVLLKGSPFNFSQTIGKKYNATIHFQTIPFKTKRGLDFSWEEYDKSLKQILKTLLVNIAQGEKTLVCIWKSPEKQNDLEESNSSKFRDYIKELIMQYIGEKYQDMYDVIYYGENKCKSCNEYHDFSTIILFGKWGLPSSKCAEHNLNWGTNISLVEFNMWFYIQLICRIGIRNHNGGVFNVIMSDDFDPSFIQSLDDYFRAGLLPKNKGSNSNDPLVDRLRAVGIKREHIEYIRSLCMIIPTLQGHILSVGTTTPLEICPTKEQLKSIIVSNRNFARSQKRLAEQLTKVNVHLI